MDLKWNPPPKRLLSINVECMNVKVGGQGPLSRPLYRLLGLFPPLCPSST